MPPNCIVIIPSSLYPIHPTYNLSEVGESIFDRYYQSFVGRLQNNHYKFPPDPKYESNFRQPLPASFVISPDVLTLDAGVKAQWLLFHIREDEVIAFIGQYVVYDGEYTDLYGERASAVSLKLEEGVMVTAVGVPIKDVSAICAGASIFCV